MNFFKRKKATESTALLASQTEIEESEWIKNRDAIGIGASSVCIGMGLIFFIYMTVSYVLIEEKDPNDPAEWPQCVTPNEYNLPFADCVDKLLTSYDRLYAMSIIMMAAGIAVGVVFGTNKALEFCKARKQRLDGMSAVSKQQQTQQEHLRL